MYMFVYVLRLCFWLEASMCLCECCVHVCALGRMYRGRSHTLEIYLMEAEE